MTSAEVIGYGGALAYAWSSGQNDFAGRPHDGGMAYAAIYNAPHAPRYQRYQIPDARHPGETGRT